MFDDTRSFISRPFLQSIYDKEFAAYLADGKDELLLARLQLWDSRTAQTETQDEAAFIATFFEDIWGFAATGRSGAVSHSIIPKFAVPEAGARGGSGEADLALGYFQTTADAVPQVLCEFKDIRSALDAKQNRKGSNLTPVEQCLNYVRGARRSQYGNETVQPWWGLVTDMNEFRLYWWDRAPREFMKFTIRRKKASSQAELFEQRDLLTENSESQFDRFLFSKLLHREMLIAPSGKPALWRLVERQWVNEKNIEEEFYAHYKAVRERLFNVLSLNNPSFHGTPTDLLRVSQKLLDRFIFAFYCEDMGERMVFPPQFIRDYLVARSIEPYYETDGDEIWSFFKRLFGFMNNGGVMGQTQVPHINGGLFADDPLVNNLTIPNHIFAANKQGANPASIGIDKETLLYLSARYNYAAKGDARESLSLYTLGRIFEQSITELEYRVGELEGRDTIAKLSKRKRDGVYYTPEWVVNYMVEETMGPWFAAARAESGYGVDQTPNATNPAAALAYLEKLRGIRIIDPACGSGAFLISAFRRLLEERKNLARDIGGIIMAVDETPLIADILQNNIFGVDINPSSVEIAKLALWLHSARAKAPLSALDQTIRCGNSLVGPDCWAIIDRTPENEARINPFDWGSEHYDIVLGNPPYVKLQNLMKVDADVVRYLQAQRPANTYESAQTGNFDLYLPFIELGLRVLRENGRMAYIAPSVWAVNEYGQGLKRHLHRTRQLERWIDFKSFQVFDEAITYTALQFFTFEANSTLKIVMSPLGETGDIDWDQKALAVPTDAFAADGPWLMATGEDRDLILRLARDCLRLDDKTVTKSVFQGLITSADWIYHLRKIGNNSYECSPPKRASYTVEIEDAVMKPLISGPEAERYQSPETATYLLFPYRANDKAKIELLSPDALQRDFPKAWKYLSSYEKELKSREDGAFDDETWFRFGRNQSIDKQEFQKLIVAQLVPNLRVSADYDANKYLNNVRVNGILPAADCEMSFIMAALNGAVAEFVFRRTAKPKQGGWFEANKQFIAPLPIPIADAKAQKAIGAMAEDLQNRWSNRRDLLKDAAARLATLARAKHGLEWLFPDLDNLAAIEARLPKKLLKTERAEQAKIELAALHEARIEALQGVLNTAPQLEASFTGGELKLTSNGAVVLDRIYLDDDVGQLAAAYWQLLALSRKSQPAKTFAANLCKLPIGLGSPAARQFMQKIAELMAETQSIRAKERALNEHLYELYGLSTDEVILVEKDCAKRPLF